MAWKVFELVVDGMITLKNKIIDVDNDGYLIFDGKRVGQDLPAISETGLNSYTMDFSKSRYFEYTITTDSQLVSPANQIKGQTGTLVIKNDSIGGWSIIWASDFVFPEGAPSVNQSPNSYNIFRYTVIEQNQILIEYVSDFI